MGRDPPLRMSQNTERPTSNTELPRKYPAHPLGVSLSHGFLLGCWMFGVRRSMLDVRSSLLLRHPPLDGPRAVQARNGLGFGLRLFVRPTFLRFGPPLFRPLSGAGTVAADRP